VLDLELDADIHGVCHYDSTGRSNSTEEIRLSVERSDTVFALEELVGISYFNQLAIDHIQLAQDIKSAAEKLKR
jgi:hypothetical protein